MELVVYLGRRNVDLKATVSAFALTLVPIALVYNAAHNYSYIVVQSQGLIPLLNDPLQKGWHLWPAVAGYHAKLRAGPGVDGLVRAGGADRPRSRDRGIPRASPGR